LSHYVARNPVLQNRKANAGSIARVSAPDVEALVYNAVMQKEQSNSKIPDRELLQRIVERVTVHTNELEIIFRGNEDRAEADAPTCLSPSPRAFRARRESRMRPPIRKPWIPKGETRFCGRSCVRAAGWTQSSILWLRRRERRSDP
jgi:hypothetical protein